MCRRARHRSPRQSSQLEDSAGLDLFCPYRLIMIAAHPLTGPDTASTTLNILEQFGALDAARLTEISCARNSFRA
jgi:hypothetical protein